MTVQLVRDLYTQLRQDRECGNVEDVEDEF